MNTIDKYIKNILKYVELSKKEELEIEKEIRSYLTERTQEYKNLGFSNQEALNKSMISFGDPKDIGPTLANSIFPQRKWSLNGLLIASFIYICSLYIMAVVLNANVMPPLIFGLTGISLLFGTYFLVSRQLFISHFKVLFLLFMTLHLILSFIGTFYFDSYENSFVLIFFRIIFGFYIVFIIINLSLGFLYKPKQVFYKKNSNILKNITLIVNCMSGVFVVGYCLLMIAGFWFFGIDSEFLNSLKSLIIPMLILILWIIIIFINTLNKFLLYLGFVVQIVLVFYIINIFYY